MTIIYSPSHVSNNDLFGQRVATYYIVIWSFDRFIFRRTHSGGAYIIYLTCVLFVLGSRKLLSVLRLLLQGVGLKLVVVPVVKLLTLGGSFLTGVILTSFSAPNTAVGGGGHFSNIITLSRMVTRTLSRTSHQIHCTRSSSCI